MTRGTRVAGATAIGDPVGMPCGSSVATPATLAVALALAAPARADVRPTGGVAVGVLAQPSDDDAFSGGLLTGHGGVRLDPSFAAVLRVGFSHDTYLDPFDPVTYDDTYVYAVPSLRARAGVLWVETGLGWRGRWQTITGQPSTVAHRLTWWLGLGLTLGPADKVNLELGLGLVTGAGLLATIGAHY